MGSVTDRHLLGVWNPSYAADAMDAHLRLLLANTAAYRAGKLPEEEVYVWWGKVRSPYRLERLPQLDEILAMDDSLDPDGERELHLYLTDYRSLYVGHVYEITADDVRGDEGSHVPAYYTEANLQCDCWFRLGDIRRLVLDDTVAVIDELRKLRNTHYQGRPVSLYGGMVNLPLVVTRDDGVRFFDPDVREALLEGKHWVEADASRTGLGAVERDLRENLFGAEAWNRLDVTTRTSPPARSSRRRSRSSAPTGPTRVSISRPWCWTWPRPWRSRPTWSYGRRWPGRRQTSARSTWTARRATSLGARA